MDSKLTEIVTKIADYLHPTKIYIFGSRARGDADYESDYDLLVIYDGSKNKRRVKREILDLFDHFDFSLDLFVLSSEEFDWQHRIANTIAREISLNGVVLYG